jgi:hypothetical protein
MVRAGGTHLQGVGDGKGGWDTSACDCGWKYGGGDLLATGDEKGGSQLQGVNAGDGAGGLICRGLVTLSETGGSHLQGVGDGKHMQSVHQPFA